MKKKITSISVLDEEENKVYYCEIKDVEKLKELFENKDIDLIGFELSRDYVLLKENNITMNKIKSDVKIAAYLLNPTFSKYSVEILSEQYLEINIEE